MNDKNAKIVAFSTYKGGSGKSTLSFNFGSYLALKGYKILFIDLDTQMNMTSNFKKLMDDRKEVRRCSIFRAFHHDADDPASPFAKDFGPAHVAPNIDIFSSHPKLDTVDRMMSSEGMTDISSLVVFDVIHRMDLRRKYDYIILDTHNNFKTLTKNALVVSDIVFSPVIPNRYGIDSIPIMVNKLRQLKKEFYDIKTGRSRITAKLYFLGNMIKFNTKASHQFYQLIQNSKDFVASFHDRELFNRATTSYQSVYSLTHKENSSAERNDEKTIDTDITPNFVKMNKVVQSR